MKSREPFDKEIWKCTVGNKRVIPYWDEEIPELGKSFFSILKAFQIEVFSFLIGTSKLGRGSFEEFKNAFNRYFDFLKLSEERISRALDIALDSGLIKAVWTVKDGVFYREFRNDSEASGIFKDILMVYEQEILKEKE